MKKFLFLLISVLFFGLFGVHLKADVAANYNLSVNINSDLSSQMNLVVELSNTSDSSLISGYTMELPYQVAAVDATLDSNPVSVILDTQSGGSNIKIDFLTYVIKPGSKANLNLTIFSLNSLKEIFKMKEFTLPYPSSNYTYSSINVSIIYPVVLGSISYSSEYKYNLERVDDNYSKVSFEQTAPIKFLWGEPEFNAVFRSSITNRKDSENHYIYGLIPEYADQEVNYKQMFNADYALTDKLNNVFAFLTVPSNGNLLLNSEASIKLNTSSKESTYPEKYNWNLNLDSTLGQKIYSNINQGTDEFSKFKSVNDFIFQEYNLNTVSIELSELNSVWQSDKKDLNPLQYCYVIISTAEYLGHKAAIEYGYNLFNNSSMIEPSIWCKVTVGDKDIIFDFSDQKANGFSQIVTSSVNRLKMGIWHPSQTYNDLLGLLTEEPVKVDITDYNEFISNLSSPQLNLEFPPNVYSGEFYSGKLFIVNPTSNLLTFKDLKVNNESVLPNITVGQLYKAVMPLQQTVIKIDYLRENDFILNLSREITVSADFGGTTLNNSIQVRFEPDYKLLAVFFLILILTVSIFIYLVAKVLRRKV